MTEESNPLHEIEPALRRKLDALYDEGQDLWEQFDREVRQQNWHPFVNANYRSVEQALLPFRGRATRFLEWGSATGVITIMADLLGFDACGIELDGHLVETARRLAARYGSQARFAAASYLPTGYEYRSPTGDHRLGTIGTGESGYLALGRQLDEFDLIFGYPWTGEEPVMLDLIRRYADPNAWFLMQTSHGAKVYRGGRLETA